MDRKEQHPHIHTQNSPQCWCLGYSPDDKCAFHVQIQLTEETNCPFQAPNSLYGVVGGGSGQCHYSSSSSHQALKELEDGVAIVVVGYFEWQLKSHYHNHPMGFLSLYLSPRSYYYQCDVIYLSCGWVVNGQHKKSDDDNNSKTKNVRQEGRRRDDRRVMWERRERVVPGIDLVSESRDRQTANSSRVPEIVGINNRNNNNLMGSICGIADDLDKDAFSIQTPENLRNIESQSPRKGICKKEGLFGWLLSAISSGAKGISRRALIQLLQRFYRPPKPWV